MPKQEIILQTAIKSFEAEDERASSLTAKAEKQIAAISIVVGFRLIELEKLTLCGQWRDIFSDWLALVAFLFLGVAFLLAILGMRVRSYLSYPRDDALVNLLETQIVTEKVAGDKIIKMYVKAHKKNADINDNRAKRLFWSGLFLLIGFILAIISYSVEKISA